MYEALTGELPIRGRNRRELLDLHQRQAPQSLRARRPDLPLPPELDAAVMRCLRKRMSDRPATAGELEQMLSAIPLEGLPDRYPPDVSRRPSRSATRTLKAVPSRPPRE
jgi:serine/threonine-protein kinase